MSIDPLSASPPASTSHCSRAQQIRQDLSTLRSDLQSGNVGQAQQDFATLLDDAPRLKNALSGASSGTNASSVASSLGSLSTALQAGDTSGASSALTSLQQSLSVAHHHRHHHHGGGGGGLGSSPDANNSVVSGDMQTLAGALQSGNLAAAQQAFAQLQQDDPALALAGSTPGATPGTAATPSIIKSLTAQTPHEHRDFQFR